MKRLSWVVLVGVALSAPVALGGEGNKDRAKELFALGVSHFKDGDYAAASEAFQRAYSAHATWKLYYNIGQCEAALKRYGLAMEAFENYLFEGGDDISTERQNEVRMEIDRLRDLSGSLKIRGPAGAVVEVDGVERGTLPLPGPLRVAGGMRKLRLEREGTLLLERKVRVSSNAEIEIEVKDAVAPEPVAAPEPAAAPEPEESEVAGPSAVSDTSDMSDMSDTPGQSDETSPSPLATAGWLTAGVGAGAAIAGAVIGGVALSKKGQLLDDCPDGACTDESDLDEADKGKKLALAADILIPTGAVLVGAGVAMILVDAFGDEEAGEKSAELGVSPLVGPGGGGLLVEGRF